MKKETVYVPVDGKPILIKLLKSYTYPKGKKCRVGLFMCMCGNEFQSKIQYITNGRKKNCGCAQRKGGLSRGTHSTSSIGVDWKTKPHAIKIYKIWNGIKSRCFYRKNKDYKSYGGRGVIMCTEWRNNFISFYNDVIDGYSEGMQLDRFPNNDGNYEPSNFRWATCSLNNRNRRNTIKVEVNEKTISLIEFCEQSNLDYQYVYRKLKKGISIKDIIK